METVYKKNIIIGAGQSGLAMAYYLETNEDDYLILEKECVSSTWKKHYDSLKLITPNPFISLPGKKFETKSTFPSKNEVVDYLNDYAKTFKLNISLKSNVKQVYKNENNIYIVETENIIYECKNLIIASGYNGIPFIPNISKNLNSSIIQYHSSEYKSLKSFPEKRLNIAVIGSGNSGISIAKELSNTHDVFLFQGKVKRMPRKVLGKDIFWVANKLGLFKLKQGTFLGNKMAKKLIPKGDTTYGLYPKTISKKYNIKLFERLTSCKENVLTDKNGNKISIDGIVWATGYRTNYHSFINLDIFDKDTKQVEHFRGVTKHKGLYFMGLKWQSNITSFLIFGVGDDAKYIYDNIKSKS